jgi:hypothetical protein
LATAWASEAAKTVGTLVEPAWTWNVIVTVVVGLMVWNLKRNIAKADELKEKIISNAIASLEKSITDWQNGAKERTKGICDKIDGLAKKLESKVDDHECSRVHHVIDTQMEEIKRKLWQ